MIDRKELRKRAEKVAQTKASSLAEVDFLPPEEISERILHELQVHQIELEMQNEELRQAQTQLEILQARYFDLYDLAPVGYCTLSEHGLILEANIATSTLLGRSRADLVKQPITRFIQQMDQTLYYRHRQRLMETGEPQGWELRMLKTDGSIVWVHLQAAMVDADDKAPTWRIVLADITTRKATEEALARAATVQNAIFNSTHFLSIATDTKGLIQVFNIGAERMLGYSAAEVVDKLTPSDFSDPEELITRASALTLEFNQSVAPSFEALIFKASRGMEDIYEVNYLRKDGGRVPAAMSVSALRDAQKTIIGYLLIGTDNTSRQRAEAERARHGLAIENKNIELEIAKTIAEKANLAKSDFLSNMSHELRTPLNAILGFAQILQSGPPEPSSDQKASIDQVLKAGWYLLDLVNEILDLAKIDAGKIALSLEPTTLADILRDGQDLLKAKAEKREIRLAFPPFKTPIYVNADPMRLKQVFVNLLSNAIKFNKVGGTVEVTCSTKPQGRVRIGIQDTGMGLSQEQISQLFQPFNRLGQKENIVEGTGVGLVVSKRLIELMGGKIGVDSTVGKGSLFWIELHKAKESMAAHQNTSEVQAQQPAQEGSSQKTVLCVEDNPANLQLVESILSRRADISLLSASSGHSGIEIARAAKPDVILMDIRLPDISGIEALKILKEDHATAQIPVLAISAQASPRDIAEAMEAGFFQYLAKPINLTEFLSAMDAALNLRKQKVF